MIIKNFKDLFAFRLGKIYPIAQAVFLQLKPTVLKNLKEQESTDVKNYRHYMKSSSDSILIILNARSSLGNIIS